MKYILLPILILSGIACGALPAQSLDTYQQAFIEWLKSSADLERDAATAAETLAARADSASADAAKFESARKAFFDAQRAQLAEAANRLQPMQLPSDTQAGKTASGFLTSQDAVLASSIESFANDRDEGIQRLRQALDKERAALTALRTAMESRETATEAAKLANETAERARSGTDDQMKAISASFEQSARDAGTLAEEWPAYYRALVSGARGIGPVDAAPATAIRPSISTASTTPPAPATSGRPAVPLARYTGAWQFLPGVSTYHGLPPLSFDMVVKAEGGQITGTVSATYDIGTRADPGVRFTFSGPLQAGRNQAFSLQTAEGATGKVELIPGSAFNLLEVNFKLEGAPGKVGESDVILVRK
jgi:hypothetical protein